MVPDRAQNRLGKDGSLTSRRPGTRSRPLAARPSWPAPVHERDAAGGHSSRAAPAVPRASAVPAVPRKPAQDPGPQPARCHNAPVTETCRNNLSFRRVARGAPASAAMPGSRPSGSFRVFPGRPPAAPGAVRNRRNGTTRRSGPSRWDSAAVPAGQRSDGRDRRVLPGFARPTKGGIQPHPEPMTHREHT